MHSIKLIAAVAMLAVIPGFGVRAQAAVDCNKPIASIADHEAMDHAAHNEIMKGCAGPLPTSPGQAAYGAIAEVVRLLKADPKTDWFKVNVEALRQHLIDMDDVTMHASVIQRNVPGGVELTVSGEGRTAEAIQRLAANHGKMLDEEGEYHAFAKRTSNGATMTVTARNVADARAVAQVRGLGFAGLRTEGDHHSAHHLALARGDAGPHGK
jgi:hypothetical protein